jgi:hypothetical protein
LDLADDQIGRKRADGEGAQATAGLERWGGEQDTRLEAFDKVSATLSLRVGPAAPEDGCQIGTMGGAL